MISTYFYLSACLLACSQNKKSSDSSTGDFSVASGDILISSLGTKDVKVFDSTGVYKGILLDIDNTTGQAPYGMAYNYLSNEILVAVDSATSHLI